jgi:hypothetical protein
VIFKLVIIQLNIYKKSIICNTENLEGQVGTLAK